MTKNIVILSVLTAILMASSPNANAVKTLEKCEQQQQQLNNIAYSQCLDAVRDTVNRELQTWINNQIFILEERALSTGRGSALAMFKRSQSNFITFRENNCRWQYLAMSPSIDAGPAFKKCYILVTKDRINELSQVNSN